MVPTNCQKCGGTIAPLEGRWMFTPPGAPPALHLDKCVTCGEWTPAEEQIVIEKLKQLIMQSQAQGIGSCNCTGTR